MEERNRMAREVHDTLAQGFTGIVVQLEAAEEAISQGQKAKVSSHLERAGELARESFFRRKRFHLLSENENHRAEDSRADCRRPPAGTGGAGLHHWDAA